MTEKLFNWVEAPIINKSPNFQCYEPLKPLLKWVGGKQGVTKRSINSKGDGRGKVKEVVITNYSNFDKLF